MEDWERRSVERFAEFLDKKRSERINRHEEPQSLIWKLRRIGFGLYMLKGIEDEKNRYE